MDRSNARQSDAPRHEPASLAEKAFAAIEEDGLGAREIGGRDGGEDAEDVEVGVLVVVIAGGRRAVEDDGYKPVLVRFLEAFYEFVEFFIHGEL